MTYRYWTTGEVARLTELRQAGVSISRCAAALGRTVKSVARALDRFGLRGRALPWQRRKGEMKKVVLRVVRKNGVSGAADILGVSRTAIYLCSRER